LPDELRQRLKLPGLARSLRFLHRPPPGTDLDTLHARNHPAWRRVKFDEVLAQQLSLRRAYLARREQGAPVLAAQDDLGERLLASLPFGLTGAQARAMAEIGGRSGAALPDAAPAAGRCRRRQDHRRRAGGLPGDFGRLAGGLHGADRDSCRAALPETESWLEPLGVEVAWLSGSLKRAAKREQLAATASRGATDCRHPCADQEGVDFAKLGLAIVDEQHRFGVASAWRCARRANNPHQLMMSATPIPRTLAMSYYADLDVTVLDELPPGRTPIKTRLVADAGATTWSASSPSMSSEGRQAYWVCPLIEESEALQLQTAQDTYEQLWPICRNCASVWCTAA
jgi:ATP-dependent DNA helicase RecG